MLMTKSAKTIWLFAIAAGVILVLVFVGRDIISGRSKVIACGDGSRRTIDIRDFTTKYSGYSVELEASIADKVKVSTKVNPTQLQQLSESLQSANEFRRYVVAGFNSCAITKVQYAQYGARFQVLDNLAHEVNQLVGNSSLSQQQATALSGLISKYGELAGRLGAE
jgi:hypothetical protein